MPEEHDSRYMDLPVLFVMPGGEFACPCCVYKMGLLDLPAKSPVTDEGPSFNTRLLSEGFVVAFEDGFDATMVEVAYNLAKNRVGEPTEANFNEFNQWLKMAVVQLIKMEMVRRCPDDQRLWETVENGEVTSRGAMVFTE